MELAEFMTKIIVLVTLTIGIVGTMVQVSAFQTVTQSAAQDRLSIDFGQAVLSAPCLTAAVGGESRKGLLDSQKLDLYNGAENFCINAPGEWNVEITEGENKWTIGGTVPIKGISKRVFPAAIEYPDKTMPAVVTVSLNGVGGLE